ncbi:jg7576 [Pararge aegeria aegeria]|uniref:Jg7576 protein n=1 Tax=Pararge aegeria aegeria TaxID=348720 RepID=A0A8S4SBC2_9NEOP|nr:jg7576 [Pararge aegeria aegeria]
MGHDEKKGTIILDNFNSTANLASNPGFQSTLSLGSKDVINEKAYNPFEHRRVEHPNSTIGSLVHLLKSSLGSGILAMPAAFKNAGLAIGAFGTIIVGFICTHCVYVLRLVVVCPPRWGSTNAELTSAGHHSSTLGPNVHSFFELCALPIATSASRLVELRR